MNREGDSILKCISPGTRWMAVVAGCSSFVFGAAAYGSPILILGAAIQPRAPTSGKWLMWLGALLLTCTVVPFGPRTVLDLAKTLPGSGAASIVIFSLFVLSPLLVLWCDATILRDALQLRHHQWVPGSLDWVAWLAAVALTAGCIWASAIAAQGQRLQGSLRHDLFLTVGGLDLLILIFDVALVIHMVKTRYTAEARARR
jgi:hypothetical protein